LCSRGADLWQCANSIRRHGKISHCEWFFPCILGLPHEPSKYVRHIFEAAPGSRLRKGDDGKDEGDDDATCGGTRPAPSTSGSQAGDGPARGAWDDRKRGPEALLCPHASHDGLSAARVGCKAKARMPWPSDDTGTPSSSVERFSPFCWTIARAILRPPVQQCNGASLSASASQSASVNSTACEPLTA
jgi:hypothetical protein